MPRKITPPGYHEVDPGDWISKIAEWYGLPTWEEVWNHGNNAALRAKRVTPNIIHPGDLVFVPAPEEKKENKNTDAKHPFVLKRRKSWIRVRLIDELDRPRVGQPYALVMEMEDGERIIEKGTTDGDGEIKKHEVPVKLTHARLYFEYQVIQLRVGHVDPVTESETTVTGIQQRLTNLGYTPGKIDGIMGPRTTEAIKQFQFDHPKLKVDGIVGPQTRAKLKEIHGS